MQSKNLFFLLKREYEKMIFNKMKVLKRWEEKDKKELFKLASNVKVSYPSGFLPHLSEKDSERVKLIS